MVTIWLNGPSAPGWCGTFTAPVPLATVAGEDASTLASTDPNYHARWQDSGGAEHTVIDVTINGSVVPVGLEGSPADSVFVPTEGNEQWTATVDVGQVPQNGTPSANAITSAPFTVPAPPAPAATLATDAWIDQLIITPSTGQWGWINLYTTLPFSNPDFKGARWTVQNGHYTNPNDPTTFVGGTYQIGGNVTAQHGGQEVPFTDYDANTVYRMPGTNIVSIQNNNPATMWTIPDYILSDGTVNQDNVFRLKNYVASPLSQSATNDATWTQQDDWSSAVGVGTPGQAAYLDIVFNLSNGTQSAGNLNPNTKAPGQVIPLGQWLGLDSSNNVTLATSLASLMTQIAAAGYTIPDSLLQDQKQLTYSASQAAVTYASGAVAANTLVDSNVASVSIGKLVTGVNGTVVFASDVYLARGSGYPVLALSYSGVYLYGAGSAGGSGVTPGQTGTPTYTASGLTGYPYVAIQNTGFFAYSGGSGPSVSVTGSAVTLYSISGSTAYPNVTLTGSAVALNSGGSFSTTISPTQIQMLYGSSVATTLSTLGLTIQNGSYFSYVGSTGVLLGYYPALSVPPTLAQMQASTAFLLLTNTYLELVSGSSYITINNSGSITLYVSSQNNLQLSGGVMTLNFAGYSASVSVGQYGLSTQGMNLQGNLHLGATGQSSTIVWDIYNSLYASASSGSYAVPANAAGFILVYYGSTAYKIALYPF